MDTISPAPEALLLGAVSSLLAPMRARAGALDAQAAFPSEELDALREAGALAAPLPRAQGGLGLGTEQAGATSLARLLTLLGSGSIAVGRLYEGHVNAVRLVCRYADATVAEDFAADLRAGHLSAIWATEAQPGVRLAASPGGWRLSGRKLFCSGATHATRPVITATGPDGAPLLALLRLAPGERARLPEAAPQGVRAAASAPVDLDGLEIGPSDVFGTPGDYLREPDFSGGAWRALAVALGGIEAVSEAARATLVARGRDAAPAQRARIGEMLVAAETARLWVCRAAGIAEDPALPSGDRAGYVNLARHAVEAAAMKTMALATRGVGLAAFVPPASLERLLRDLGMYLRQPAPDEALHEAAGWFARDGLGHLPRDPC